ncbi:hypothetical protein [Thiococcus pfennigii]|jgi:hypothetical protein|uniref:hypothetical protein n=1 Tax=Thiococcus pfennigii TaxID=1057 RepID=UPI00190579DE|nr:hypothetical protein [Thiococcus pfennigii]MBK1700961.1 hypothetical protein [Thiococcus pfennigii]MBK1732890.1 hypothetical protein [Thiococcus pfennigii]
MLHSRVKASLIACAALLGGLVAEVGFDGGLLVPEAQAVIGRPMTPMSYAGVARRTTRRAIYVTSVYRATLPVGCTTVIIEGTTLHRCGATYYQPWGGQYVVVQIQ